jgi:3-oxoacyl-(acyl-carrier-protein) synthase
MGDRDVVVTGTAALSPFGAGVAALWDGLVGGRVGTAEVTRFDPAPYATRHGGQVPAGATGAGRDLPAGTPLAVRYAVAVVAAALRDAGMEPGPEVALCLGTVMGTRPHLEHLERTGADPAADPRWVESGALVREPARVLGLGGPVALVATGCSAGNDAIGHGCDLIAAGRAECVVAGGVEELAEAVFSLFTALRALAPDVVRPFDAGRRGILPAEGAAALVLEPAGRARARGARVLARVAGYAAAADAHHLTAPHPDARALVDCLRAVLARAGRAASDVDYVCAHGTGTPASDGVEAAALARVFPAGPAVSSVKGALGHAQGAASALEAVACVQALRTGLVPGMPTLREPDPACAVVDLVAGAARRVPVGLAASVAFGFGGSTSAVLLEAAA